MGNLSVLQFQFFILLFLAITKYSVAQVFKLSDYLEKGEKDATLSIIMLLEEAARHVDSKVIIEKGIYHFYPEKAYEQFCFITNHDNSMRRIAFNIKNFNGLTLDAKGSTFIFHGVMMPFNIENSKKINLSNFTIDWHIPLHSEGLIEANDTINNSFDLRLADNLPYTIRNSQLVFIKEGYEHDLSQAILYDPDRKAVAYNTSKYTELNINNPIKIRNKDKIDYHNFIDFRIPEYQTQEQEYSIKAKELEHGLVRISGLKKLPPPVGMVLVCKGRFGKARIANAFHINKSKKIKLNDITIYHAGGMGVIAERSEDITLENINILANPDKDIMVSTTADATHFASCKGNIVIDRCNFKHQLDDGTNIHGAFVLVEDIISLNKIGVRIGHFQQAGFQFAEAGDLIGFFDPTKAADVQFKATVKSFNQLNQNYYILTLKENITEKISKGYIVENLDWYPEISITNNQFADNRARGILIKSPKKTIVRNNYFSNMMQAVIISGGVNTWWYESGFAMDVIIEDNVFGDCSYDGEERHVINIGGGLKNKGRKLGKIVINNNTFNNFNPSIIRARRVSHLEFTNNTISNSKTFSPININSSVMDIKQVDTLKIDNIEISKDFINKWKIENVMHNLSVGGKN